MFHEEQESNCEEQLERAANRYADGIMRGGLRRSERLERALAARAVESARVKHQARADRSLRRNVGAIMNAYHERDREIRREGVYMAWATCPLAAFVFGGVSWYNLDRGDVLMGVLCALFGLSFLVMLVLAQLRRKGGR